MWCYLADVSLRSVVYRTAVPMSNFVHAVLLEESKTASPLVAGAYVSEVACPRVANTAMIFIFLPRLSLFYIMTHAVGATPVPFMRIPWLGCNQVLTVEVSPALNSLVAVAGNTADGKFRMRAWTILGDEGCSLEGLRLQPRNCSQSRRGEQDARLGEALEWQCSHARCVHTRQYVAVMPLFELCCSHACVMLEWLHARLIRNSACCVPDFTSC
jgi:hypothetical protein